MSASERLIFENSSHRSAHTLSDSRLPLLRAYLRPRGSASRSSSACSSKKRVNWLRVILRRPSPNAYVGPSVFQRASSIVSVARRLTFASPLNFSQSASERGAA